jgi:DNA-directed RNA polymerase sigma subunit (sigma70/sigma32)
MTNISRDEAIYFLDMIGSSRSPNHQPRLGKRKPYYALLKDRETKEYKSFIEIYLILKNILSEKECLILERVYGINQECVPMHTIGEDFNIKAERVRQIKTKAEFRLASAITKMVNLKAGI